MTDARTTTEETGLTTSGIEAYLTSLSNWGRWGDDDRIGTLNLITDEVRVAAASTIRTGRAVSLSRPIDSRSRCRMKGPNSCQTQSFSTSQDLLTCSSGSQCSHCSPSRMKSSSRWKPPG